MLQITPFMEGNKMRFFISRSGLSGELLEKTVERADDHRSGDSTGVLHAQVSYIIKVQ
jgi:hypothetical protein